MKRSIVLAALFLLIANSAFAAAQRTTIYNFGGGGTQPMTFGKDGALYGALSGGGPEGAGQIYKLQPPVSGGSTWSKTVLYDFADDGNGRAPGGDIVVQDDGSIFGVTGATGGPGQDAFGGPGTIFKLAPAAGGTWSKSVLHYFNGLNGRWPVGGLTSDGQGGFFGNTVWGGSMDGGTSFHLAPQGAGWAFNTIFDFTWGFAYALPITRPARDAHGNLYFPAFAVAAIALSPPTPGQTAWTETILKVFPSGDFRAPYAIDKNGVIYGTSVNKIVSFTPPNAKQKKWKTTTLMTFSKKTKAQYGLELQGVIVDSAGNLFGVTAAGGTSTECGKIGCGTTFKLSPPVAPLKKWTIAVLHQEHGGYNALIADSSGVLYGTTTTVAFKITGSGFQP